MPTIFTLPWRWTRQPRPERAPVFASIFEGAGPRAGWQLFVGGLRLRRAVLNSHGALGVSIRAYPLRGCYQTLSMWADEESLIAFAYGAAHQAVARRITERGPVSGILVSRDADPKRRPTWSRTGRWAASVAPGPYQRQGVVRS